MDFIGNFGNPNLPDILFRAERRDELIALRTYDRAHGGKGRFLIVMDALQEWLNGGRERPFYDSDCGNLLVLRLHGGVCRMRIVWLSAYGNGELHGVQQDVEIPENQLLTLIRDGTSIRRLCRPQTGSVHFDARPAGQVIRGVLSNKRKRRAFSKALRDSFRWRDDSRVTLYPDGADSFYFDAGGDWPMCGGLILHEDKVRTLRGSFPRLYYGIHT